MGVDRFSRPTGLAMQTGFSQSGTWDVRGSREAHNIASDSKVREEKVTKRTHRISRRNALRLAVIAAATAGVAKPGIIRMAFAQDKTPIKIGFPVPLSGIYGDYAKDQVNGAQLAITSQRQGRRAWPQSRVAGPRRQLDVQGSAAQWQGTGGKRQGRFPVGWPRRAHHPVR